MRSLAYFLARDLLHDYARSLWTVLSLVAVVVGFLLLACLAGVFQTFGRQSRLTDNLVILSADALDPMESSLSPELLQTARQIAPGQVQRAFPMLFRHLTIQGRILQVSAVPLEEMSKAAGLTLLSGAWPVDPGQVVMSTGVARATAWQVGSIVNIYGSDFRVTGLVQSAGDDYGAIWMTYSEGQRLFGMARGFQIAVLPLDPAADPESVRRKLQADPRLPARYAVYLENALSDRYSQVNHNLLTLSNLLALVSLSAITFGIYNATSLTLAERGHEIGLLRVIGFSQARLRGFLFARTLALTLAAYGLGWAAALILIRYLAARLPIDLLVAPLNLSLSPSTAILGMVFASLFAFLGTWLTTRRLAALSPLAGRE
jgi:ABC-type antimicrobial peptide transport system permease subunit